MGMPSFYRIPVQSVIADQEIFACKGEYVTIGAPALPGYSYQWKNMTTGASSTSAQWKVKANATTNYRLIYSYNNTNCSSADTLYFTIQVDRVEIPAFSKEYILCSDESLSLNPDTSYWMSFEWNAEESWNYRVDSTIQVQWTGISRMDCMYNDSFATRSVRPMISLEDTIMICKGAKATIQLAGFDSYYWNGVLGDSSIVTGPGELEIAVEKEGCMDTSRHSILEFPKPIQPEWYFEVCANEALHLLQPDEIKYWSISDSSQPAQITVIQEGITEIEWADSFTCQYLDTLVRVNKQIPKTEELKDTGLCTGDTITIYVGPEKYTYSWSDSAGDLNQRSLARGGFFTVDVTDTNNCRILKNFDVAEWPMPSLDIFRDTVLCKDSLWTLYLSDGLTYKINGSTVIDQITLYPDSNYKVIATNDHSCTNSKSIRIESIDCNVNVLEINTGSVLIYPNPVNVEDAIQIESALPIEKITLFDELGREIGLKTEIEDHFAIEDQGVFFLSILFKSGDIVYKMIIVH